MLTLLLSLSTAHAGAWTQPQGQHYGKVNGRIVSGRSAFDLDGELVETDPFTDANLQAYYEVGLTDLLTLVYTGTPLGRVTFAGTSAPYLGPNAVGVRRALWNQHLKVAAEGRVGWTEPFSDGDLVAKSGATNTPEGFVYTPTVANHFLDLALSLGRGVGNGWVTGAIGGRVNTGEGLGEAVIGNAQFGWTFKGKFVVDAHTSWYLPNNPVEQVNISGGGDTRYFGFGFGFGWWVRPDLGLVVTAEGAPVAVSNAGSPSLCVGLQFR